MQLFMLQRQRPCRSQRKKKQPLGLNGPQNAFDEEMCGGVFLLRPMTTFPFFVLIDLSKKYTCFKLSVPLSSR